MSVERSPLGEHFTPGSGVSPGGLEESEHSGNSGNARDRTRHSTIGVVGGGSWGTTLAHLIASNGAPVLQWIRDPDVAEAVNRRHENPRYLTGHALHPGLVATTALQEVGRTCRLILVIVPSHSAREVARELGDHLDGSQLLVHGIKGIEPGTYRRVSEILREETCVRRIGVLSGPNLAREVIAGQPSATVIASAYQEVIDAGIEALRCRTFRVYGSRDLIGSEVGGAIKNVFAIAAGAAHGLGFGDNTKALLLTRGLAEMSRLGNWLGANPLTFAGLSGIGDLMATCFSPLSRNFQVGLQLAQGASLAAITARMGQVAEGVRTTATIHAMAEQDGLYMPITEAVYQVLYGNASPPEALQALLETARSPFESDLLVPEGR